ncbi:MAG TPA: aldo/keto reductase [Mycobacteriales bacterium]|nr:aldo/keto reductase [Mycobacteriales bacterium]
MTDAPQVPTDTAVLPSGAAMPLLGFGTWRLSGEQAVRATAEALSAGYRHVDTATMYGNEREIGRALAEHRGESVFVTTKLPPERAGRERETLEQSLEALGVESVDLWLVHWPPGGAGVRVWERFVAARADGLVRDIGVSNYSVEQIDELDGATGVRPAVNQVPWSPRRFDAALLERHRERGVVLEGYSGLKDGVLDDRDVREMADRLDRTPAQVVLRWHLEHGVVVIPKSSDPERIRSNADVGGWRLDPDDVAVLDALGRSG